MAGFPPIQEVLRLCLVNIGPPGTECIRSIDDVLRYVTRVGEEADMPEGGPPSFITRIGLSGAEAWAADAHYAPGCEYYWLGGERHRRSFWRRFFLWPRFPTGVLVLHHCRGPGRRV